MKTRLVLLKYRSLRKAKQGGQNYLETGVKFSWKSPVNITIIKEELIVNDKTYGLLEPKDSILIDHGIVYIQDKKVEGRPLSDEEKLESAMVKETEEELAGYSVTVRPGASTTMKTEVFGKHTLRVGKTNISVKNDKLFVNNKPYGELKTGDTVVIKNNKVFVSGEERFPN